MAASSTGTRCVGQIRQRDFAPRGRGAAATPSKPKVMDDKKVSTIRRSLATGSHVAQVAKDKGTSRATVMLIRDAA